LSNIAILLSVCFSGDYQLIGGMIVETILSLTILDYLQPIENQHFL